MINDKKINSLKNAKIQSLNIVCKDLNCEDIKNNIIEKINNCNTLEEINEFGVAEECLKIIDSLDFIKQKKEEELINPIKEELQKTDCEILKLLEDIIESTLLTDIKKKRKDLREKMNNIKNQINASTTIESVQKIR